MFNLYNNIKRVLGFIINIIKPEDTTFKPWFKTGTWKTKNCLVHSSVSKKTQHLKQRKEIIPFTL